MKTKNKSATQIYATKVTSKRVITPLVDPKLKQKLINIKQSRINKKGDKKQTKIHDKQNTQSTNVPSPQNALRGKNYKPILKKATRLQLSQNTVNVTINESHGSANKKELLQTLLYGDIELSYTNNMNLKQQDADQLLIDFTQKSNPVKIYKNLSPIKSISEYSVTQNDNNIFVAQKIQNPTANVLIKLNICQNYYKKSKIIHQSVVLRRLLLHFRQKTEGLLNLYCSIHKVFTKKQLKIKIREYLFKNSIIFNKTELQQFMEIIDKLIQQAKVGPSFQQICGQKIQIAMRQLFLDFDASNETLTKHIWVSEEVSQRLFQEKDMVSIWRLAQQICTDSLKQIESSFRQSRFCLSLTSSQFVHETDQKRRKQNLEILCKWLGNFIRAPSFNSKPESLINFKQQLKINSILHLP